MKKFKLLFGAIALAAVTLVSCSKDDDNSSPKQFEFLEFDKDVVQPSINPKEITFLAINFDSNKNNWEVTLTNPNNEFTEVNLTEIKETGTGYKVGDSYVSIQRIAINAHPKEEGTYTLTLKHKKSGQTYMDNFIVRSTTFNKIYYSNAISYDITAIWGLNEAEPAHNYIYYHNITNTILSNDVTTSGIASITLESVTDFKTYDLQFSLHPTYKQIEFVIPSSVPRGKYFLSVNYNNYLRNYFEKDIVVETENIPTLTSINQNTFNGGETINLKGRGFWFTINPDLLNGSLSQSKKSPTKLAFRNATGVREYELSHYEDYPSFNYMNDEGNEIKFPLPIDPIKEKIYLISDSEGTYFEGTVFVKAGPYVSNEIPIRIDYKK